MTSLGVLRQSSDMKLIDVNGAASLFTYKTSSPDGSQCLAQVSEVLDFWKKLFPSLASALSPVTLASYSTASPCEGTYVRDVTKESTLDSVRFIPLDAVLYFMSYVTFSRAEKVNLAQLLNLVLGLNVNIDDTKLHFLLDIHSSTDEVKTSKVPESETVESSDNNRKRKTDGQDVLDTEKKAKSSPLGLNAQSLQTKVIELTKLNEEMKKTKRLEDRKLNRKVLSLTNKVKSLTEKVDSYKGKEKEIKEKEKGNANILRILNKTKVLETKSDVNKVLLNKSVVTVRSGSNKRCENDVCVNKAGYNFKGENEVRFCGTHKQAGMINLKLTFCEHEGCIACATFHYKGDSKRKRFCAVHKLEGMIDYAHTRCDQEGCTKTMLFNFRGDHTGGFCSDHKLEGMIPRNGRSTYCTAKACQKIASFNFKGENVRLFCATHKAESMVAVGKTCEYGECPVKAIYNYSSESRGRFCNAHKLPDMINRCSVLCVRPGCGIRANYNIANEKGARYCLAHKPADAIYKRNIKKNGK